jgi:hypothetical protein
MVDESMLCPDHIHDDYVGQWYPYIKDVTFQTWLFEIPRPDAEALLEVNRCRTFDKPAGRESKERFDRLKAFVHDRLTEIQRELPSGSRFFIRLGSRSPKDAYLFSSLGLKRFGALLRTHYEAEFERLNLRTREEKNAWVRQSSTMNDQRIWCDCEHDVLAVADTDEIFDFLVESHRVSVDLGRDLAKEDLHIFFCIRLWDPMVRPHLEFRGFVFGHELRALTQYDNRFYTTDIGENHEMILASIQDLFAREVREKFMVEGSPFEEGKYVIDFGVILERQGARVTGARAVVIEINRFNQKTGASCFDWRRDFDVLVGRKPFEFRFVTEHQWDAIDYDGVVFPDVVEKRQQLKAEIVKKTLSFFERIRAWRD